jgi:hypothetical protein
MVQTQCWPLLHQLVADMVELLVGLTEIMVGQAAVVHIVLVRQEMEPQIKVLTGPLEVVLM